MDNRTDESLWDAAESFNQALEKAQQQNYEGGSFDAMRSVASGNAVPRIAVLAAVVAAAGLVLLRIRSLRRRSVAKAAGEVEPKIQKAA